MFPIRGMYLEAINRAGRNIWLTQAYFLPDQDFVDALAIAAQRGVDVRLLVPLKSNHIVADWISRGYYDQLLRGRRAHPAVPGRDGARQDRHHRRQSWSTVGTANIDRLSLQGNYEINVEVIDAGLAADAGGDLRHRRAELPRADPVGVGGARPPPAVHRGLLNPLRPLL